MLQENTQLVPKSDIDEYLDSKEITPDLQSISNPNWVLEWWHANSFIFPTMVLAARDHLAIPASEVDVERLFCGGRDLLGIRRPALSGDTMRLLTPLKSYYHRLANGQIELPSVSFDQFDFHREIHGQILTIGQ
jgi:hypothetical protein